MGRAGRVGGCKQEESGEVGGMCAWVSQRRCECEFFDQLQAREVMRDEMSRVCAYVRVGGAWEVCVSVDVCSKDEKRSSSGKKEVTTLER
jgi:hypothetical protein